MKLEDYFDSKGKMIKKEVWDYFDEDQDFPITEGEYGEDDYVSLSELVGDVYQDYPSDSDLVKYYYACSAGAESQESSVMPCEMFRNI